MSHSRRQFIQRVASTLAIAPFASTFDANAADSIVTRATPNMAEQLAHYAYSIDSFEFDRDSIESAKFRLIDSIGCALSAFNEPTVQICRKVAARSKQGTTTLWGTSSKCQPELSAFANGVAMRYHDLNDVYVGKTTGHPSDNIAACFAVAESVGASGRQLLEAIVLAYEIDCRLMDATDVTAKGWDHPVFTLPAVALASSKLLGSNEQKMIQSINLSLASSIAMYQTRVQQMSDWKGLADPDALRNGVFASLLAAEGVTGPSPIFEGNAGLFKQVTGPIAIDMEKFGGISSSFKINDCGYKLYPAQVYTLTSIPAAIELAKRVGDINKIASLQIATTKTGLLKSATGQEKWSPKTKETADHSLPYVASRALFDGVIDVDSYSRSKITDQVLLEFMKHVTVIEDKELTAQEPATTPCRLTATLKSGETISVQVNDMAGFPTRPMTRDALEEKFYRSVKNVLKDDQAKHALNSLWNIEYEANLGNLAKTFEIQINNAKRAAIL